MFHRRKHDTRVSPFIWLSVHDINAVHKNNLSFIFPEKCGFPTLYWIPPNPTKCRNGNSPAAQIRLIIHGAELPQSFMFFRSHSLHWFIKVDETCIVRSSAGFRLHCMPCYNEGTSKSIGELFNGYDFPGGRAEPLLPWRLMPAMYSLIQCDVCISAFGIWKNNVIVLWLCIIWYVERLYHCIWQVKSMIS